MHAYKPEPWPTDVSPKQYSASTATRADEPALADDDYEQDFVQWVEKQVRLLKARDFAALDIENLIEEIDAMARRDKRELVNRLKVIVHHLLKCRYQPEQMSSSWRGTLREQRSRLMSVVDDSPSLRRTLEVAAAKRYGDAVEDAADETGLPVSTFPKENPFTPEQLLDPDFFGEG